MIFRLTILAFLLTACSSTATEKNTEKPALDVTAMGQAMAGISLLESASSFDAYNDSITPLVMGIHGQEVLDSLGISRADFKQSIEYYQTHPEEFLIVFDSAVAHIEHLKQTTLKRNGEY